MRRGTETACRSCSALTLADGQAVLLASRWRRLGGYLLDGLLVLVTLGIGWLIWLHFSAKTAQSPAKQILGMYIISTKDGLPARYGAVWLREVVIQILLFGMLLSWVSAGIIPLVDALWILFDRQKQTLHDKVAGTLIIHAPAGLASIESDWNAPRASRPSPGPTAPPARGRAGAGPAPGGPESYGSSGVRERLGRLRDLWESGEISADEYERRRREILDEL